MATTPLFVGSPRTEILNLIPGFATRPRRLFLAGDDGSKISRINIASSDNASNNVQFFIGKKKTLASAMGTGALVDGGGGSDTITRTSSSFLTDGWLTGQRFVVDGPTTLANGFTAVLTDAAALTLTFATATVNTAENLPSTAVLYEIVRSFYAPVGAGAGVPSTAPVSGLTTTLLPMLSANLEDGFDLAADFALFAGAVTTLDSGETIGISVHGFDY